MYIKIKSGTNQVLAVSDNYAIQNVCKYLVNISHPEAQIETLCIALSPSGFRWSKSKLTIFPLYNVTFATSLASLSVID